MKRYLALLLFVSITTLAFAQESHQDKNGSSLKSTSLQFGYKGIVEMGYQFGVGNYGMDRLKLNAIISDQINPYFSFGLGMGFRYYIDAEAVAVSPLADFKINITNNNVSPYLSLGVGYSFDTSNGLEGMGILFNPTVGISFRVSGKSVINVGIGYEMQQVKFYYYNYGYNYQNFTENSSAISIVIGIHQ